MHSPRHGFVALILNVFPIPFSFSNSLSRFFSLVGGMRYGPYLILDFLTLPHPFHPLLSSTSTSATVDFGAAGLGDRNEVSIASMVPKVVAKLPRLSAFAKSNWGLRFAIVCFAFESRILCTMLCK
jgi:hypothetical protein